MPPPRRRSISSSPRAILFSAEESISLRFIGLWPGDEAATDWFLFAFPVATVCSTMVFHCPHAGHFPIHFGLSFPQLVQNHTVFSFVAIFVPLSAAKIAIFVHENKKKQHPELPQGTAIHLCTTYRAHRASVLEITQLLQQQLNQRSSLLCLQQRQQQRGCQQLLRCQL